MSKRIAPADLFCPPGFSLFQADLEHIAQHVEPLAGALRGAHLFITGGTGFFGIWLLEGLLWASQRHDLNLQVSVLSRSPEGFLKRAPHLAGHKVLRFVTGSATDFPSDGVRYSHIIHAASETNLERSADWPLRHFRTAMDGTQRLLDMASAHKSEAVLVTTSGAVYLGADIPREDRFFEAQSGIADYLSEKHLYGQVKRTMEIMTCLGASQHGYRGLIARCFAFIGPYLPMEGNYAAGNFLRDALAEKPIVIEGDGTPLRSYMYMADLAAWLLTILVRGGNGTPYNVGGGRAVSIAELANCIANSAGRAGTVTIRKTPMPGARPAAYLPDITRAQQDLGLAIGIDLEESVRRTLAWFRMRAKG